MKFLLNSVLVEDTEVPADMTLLRYLREQQQLVGTKEGCASGDCGACTVLVSDAPDTTNASQAAAGKVKYSAVNSCITAMGSLSGRRVVTVEALAKADKLHPAQQGLVDCDGSQCGFCTPGFVMSLAGLYQEKLATGECQISRHELGDAISGNLCRCTGYRSIIDAGLSMQQGLSAQQASSTEQSIPPDWDLDDESTTALLERISDAKPNANYPRPSTLEALDKSIQQWPEAPLIAGGTDLMLKITQEYQRFPALIDVSQVAELRRIERASTIEIGAAVTFAQLEQELAPDAPQLGALLQRIASRQIRNRGTVAGNIANASPVADLPPYLLCLDADIHLRDTSGQSRVMPLDAFYLGYKETALKAQEYIRSVSFAAESLADFHRVYKISKRVEDDISSIIAAIRFPHNGDIFAEVSIAFGGMAAVPLRVKPVEALFQGQKIDDENVLDTAIEQLASVLSPISDVRASSQYRIAMAQNALRKAWLDLNGEAMPCLSGEVIANA